MICRSKIRVDALFCQLSKHAADAGMRILYVIHGVVTGLRLGKIQVKVHVLIRLSQRIEKTRGVSADFLAQLAQGDKLSAACGHRHFGTTPVQHGKLDQQYAEIIRIQPQRRHRCLDPLDVAVVVGTPDIDDVREPALDLVSVVGDVGRKIGVVAVSAKHYAVFFISKLGTAKPPGAFAFIKKPGLFERLNGAAHGFAVDQALLREPGLVGHTKPLKV